MNQSFYALATNKKGDKQLLIDNLSNQRLQARQEAEEHAEKQGLVFQEIRMVHSQKREDRTLTKFNAYRKLNNGNNPDNYDQAL